VEDAVEYDPQLRYRHFFWKLNHHEVGELIHNRTGYLLSKTPAELRMPTALLGEHTEYVCKELLKMPEDQYVSLLLENVFK
jgi:benzylsuccinate CoA-transferase BbsF subunit